MAVNRITTIFDFSERGQGLKKIKADMAEVDGSINKAKIGVKGLWEEFKGSRAAQAAVAGVAAKMAVDAVNAASNLQESVNAVNVTFGEASEGIGQLADDAVDSYGLSERAFNEMAVAFSGFATQIAGEGGDVVAVVDDMATRVADFASVHNLEMSDAMTKFQSALAGETEAMRRYGIDVSAATVKLHAYEMGIADVGDELTESEKVQARYSLLLRETAQWAGDFENTSDSLANTQRRLTANLENTQATLGEQLLPAAEAVTSALNELAGAMETVDGITLDLTGGQAGLGDAIGAAVKNILSGNQALGVAADRLWVAEEAVKAYDESLTLTDDELERSIDILNGNTSALRNSARESTYLANETEELGLIQQATTRAVDAAKRAQEAFLRSIKFTRDEVGALKREIDDRQAWLQLQGTFADITAQTIDMTSMTREQELAMLDLKEEVLDYAESINLPDKVTTQLIADIDAGKVSEVESLLARWGNGITVPIKPQVIKTGTGTSVRITPEGNVVPGRARGGPVSSGQTYLVGEEGPELLHMGNQSGSITPNDKIGVGGSITVNIMGGYVDDRTISELERRLDQWRRGAR